MPEHQCDADISKGSSLRQKPISDRKIKARKGLDGI